MLNKMIEPTSQGVTSHLQETQTGYAHTNGANPAVQMPGSGATSVMPLQYVTNSEGNIVAVVVPITVWEDVKAEVEATYQLRTQERNEAIAAEKELRKREALEWLAKGPLVRPLAPGEPSYTDQFIARKEEEKALEERRWR